MSKFKCIIKTIDEKVIEKVIEAKDKIDAFIKIKYYIESEKLEIKVLEIYPE